MFLSFAGHFRLVGKKDCELQKYGEYILRFVAFESISVVRDFDQNLKPTTEVDSKVPFAIFSPERVELLNR